ncbi:50S ribosomal protein L24 [Candidatus Pacearchaeota archaeon CG10_big_fil_rev_8_21_14_0_10_31_24]|nr:MAG: 50S ribosomal protein L24 [Candidatus Pacearchaeota archaeon CG10_big_fil_rev_8_21_14_0_10_31_24]
MKKEFSTAWNSSTQPRKQRKFRYNAPLHKMHKFLSANLSKSLRQKYGKRSLPLRKGDEVLVMRGSSKKKKAKITEINLKNSKVALEGIQRSKKDGTKISIFFNPRALQVVTLVTDDKERLNALNKTKLKENASNKTANNN